MAKAEALGIFIQPACTHPGPQFDPCWGLPLLGDKDRTLSSASVFLTCCSASPSCTQPPNARVLSRWLGSCRGCGMCGALCRRCFARLNHAKDDLARL